MSFYQNCFLFIFKQILSWSSHITKDYFQNYFMSAIFLLRSIHTLYILKNQQTFCYDTCFKKKYLDTGLPISNSEFFFVLVSIIFYIYCHSLLKIFMK